MTTIAESLIIAAPLYNLGMVIAVIYFFIQLFRTAKQNQAIYTLPWKLMFTAVIIFVIEEASTVLRGMLNLPFTRQINGFFEVIIITLFIYALLLQREHAKEITTMPKSSIEEIEKENAPIQNDAMQEKSASQTTPVI